MRKVLFEEAWLEAFNALLEEKTDPDFMELAYAWDQPRLMDMTAQLYDFLMSLPSPFKWLDKAVESVKTADFGAGIFPTVCSRKGGVNHRLDD